MAFHTQNTVQITDGGASLTALSQTSSQKTAQPSNLSVVVRRGFKNATRQIQRKIYKADAASALEQSDVVSP